MKKEDVLKRMEKKIFVFDTDTSLMTILKLFRFVLTHDIGTPEMFSNIYCFRDKHYRTKFMLTNLSSNGVERLKSVTTIRDVKKYHYYESSEDDIKLTYNDYFLKISKCMTTLTFGKEGDQFEFYNYIIMDKKINLIMINSIISAIDNDKFRNRHINDFIFNLIYGAGFNINPIKKYLSINSREFKAFLNPINKKYFDYDQNIKYDRKYLQMLFLMAKNRKVELRFKLGPIKFSMYNGYVYLTIFNRNIYNGSNTIWYKYHNLEDIETLTPCVINCISYLLNNYPGSVRVRNSISKAMLTMNEE